MDERSPRFERRLDSRHGGQWRPFDWKGLKIERVDSVLLARYCGDGLAAIARFPMGEDGLIGERRDDAITIFAGDIPSGEDPHQARMGAHKAVKIAEFESGAIVGRAYGAQHQDPGRPAVGAENFGSF